MYNFTKLFPFSEEMQWLQIKFVEVKLYFGNCPDFTATTMYLLNLF